MKVIIPAAGYATRLGELTRDRPKHLLDVGGKPIINHLIEGLEDIPVSDVYVVTNDRFYEQFRSWSENLQTKLRVNVLNDGTTSNENRLGTIGDIWYTIEKCGIDDDLFVIGGDNLYCDDETKRYNLRPIYDSFEEFERDVGILGLYEVDSLEIAKSMGQVTVDGKKPSPGEVAKIKKYVEKDPNPTLALIATMIAVYPREIIECFRRYMETTKNHDKIGDFIHWLVEGNEMSMYGYHLRGRWFDIGLPEQLEEARRFTIAGNGLEDSE